MPGSEPQHEQGPSSLTSDVLVVGAGPAGSASAYHLARAGYRVTIVDRSGFPRDKPCSEYVGPGAVALLDRLGVTPTLRARGAGTLNGTSVIGARGSRLTGQFALANPLCPGATGLSVSRVILDACLVERAISAGARFFPGLAVDDLLSENGQVTGARVRDGTGQLLTMRARVVIGADGIRSIVARRIGGMKTGFPRRLGFVTHVRGVSGLGSLAEMHVGPAGYVGLNPLGADVTNVALVVPARRALESKGRVDAFFFEALESFPGVQGRIPRLGRLKPLMATGPFGIHARKVVANGVMLVGDAADFFDPFTGEGIYSALKGAELATAILIEALRSPALVTADRLKSYRGARRHAFGGKWAVERLIGYGMLAPALFDRAVNRLARRGKMAHTLIGVTADFLPAREVLNPLFLSRMVL
ncbi:MAG: NAD(P)/FAD-dependent oxidoreductase [Gemmatimonadota bacterium]